MTTFGAPEETMVAGHFVLRVQGESFELEGQLVRAGDYVIVQSSEDAGPGDVVLALVDGERPAMGTLRPDGTGLSLQVGGDPPGGELLDAERVQVRGLVVGIIRKY